MTSPMEVEEVEESFFLITQKKKKKSLGLGVGRDR